MENKTIHTNTNIFDVKPEELSYNIRVIYNDDELVVADNLRELPTSSSYKVAFNIVVQCHNGEAQFDVGNEFVSLKSGQTFVCHSNVTMSHVMISPDFDGSVICVSDRLMKSILQAQAGIWNRVLYTRHYCIINTNDETARRGDLNETVIESFRKSKSPFKQDILVSLLRAAFLMICERFLEQSTEKKQHAAESPRMEILFQQFLENINRRQMKKVSVAEYADELCITPKYLSTICRKVSGKSPIEWISEYVVADISFYLRNTDLTAKEIADKIGFANSSFFGKYVREHLGVSPAQYRKREREATI